MLLIKMLIAILLAFIAAFILIFLGKVGRSQIYNFFKNKNEEIIIIEDGYSQVYNSAWGFKEQQKVDSGTMFEISDSSED